jgi:hypothetical protein
VYKSTNPGFEIGKEYAIWLSNTGKTGEIQFGTVIQINSQYVEFDNDVFWLEYFDPKKYYTNCFCFEEVKSEQQKLLLKMKAEKVKFCDD